MLKYLDEIKLRINEEAEHSHNVASSSDDIVTQSAYYNRESALLDSLRIIDEVYASYLIDLHNNKLDI